MSFDPVLDNVAHSYARFLINSVFTLIIETSSLNFPPWSPGYENVVRGLLAVSCEKIIHAFKSAWCKFTNTMNTVTIAGKLSSILVSTIISLPEK